MSILIGEQHVGLAAFNMEVIGAVHKVAVAMTDLLPRHGEMGGCRGFFGLYRAERSPDVPPILLVQVGSVPNGKIRRYYTLCQEKAQRMLAALATTSWESRDEAQDRWGGAVRVRSVLGA